MYILEEKDSELWWLVGTLAVMILPVLFIKFTLFINKFSDELKFINREIARTYGDEKKHWIHRRRRLWLSLIPFVRY